jgi:hypothetical protein
MEKEQDNEEQEEEGNEKQKTKRTTLTKYRSQECQRARETRGCAPECLGFTLEWHLCGYHYSDGCLPGMSARVLKDRQMEREGGEGEGGEGRGGGR